MARVGERGNSGAETAAKKKGPKAKPLKAAPAKPQVAVKERLYAHPRGHAPTPAASDPSRPDPPAARGMARAEAFKRTPAYRGIIRRVYKDQPVKARKAISDVAKAVSSSERTLEQNITASTHAQRLASDERIKRLLGYVPRVEAKKDAEYAAAVEHSRDVTAAREFYDTAAKKAKADHEAPPKTGSAYWDRVIAAWEKDTSPAALKAKSMREAFDHKSPASQGDGLDWTKPPTPTYADLSPEAKALTDKQAAAHASPEAVKARAEARKHPAPGIKPRSGFAKLASSVTGIPAGLAGTSTSAAAIAEALYHRPGHVVAETVKSVPTVVKALPTAAVAAGTHPIDTIAALQESLATPYEEKVKRIEEHGALEDIGNAAMLLGPASKALGAAAVARHGEAAALRISGDITKTRKAAPGIVGHAVRTASDARKAASYERKATNGQELTALEREALLANRAAGHVVEVVPSRVNRKIARSVASARGRTVYALHYDLAKGHYGQMVRKLRKLSKDEQKAFWFSAAGGIRTAEQARALLPGLLAKVEAGRPTGLRIKGHDKKIDVAARIREVLADPERYFTQHLDDTVGDIVEHVDQISAADPRYSDLTKANRRRADQNVLLDLEQGVGKPHITAQDAAAMARGEDVVPGLRYADETLPEFIARGDRAAAAAGLRKPLYFKAERHRAGLQDYAAHTAGGARAMAYEGKHQGRNLNKGLVDTSTQAFLRGYARNVKAAHNWPLVERLIDEHALKGLTGDHGMHVGPALDAINNAEPVLDRGSVKLWNPGIFRREMETKGGDLAGSDFSVEEAGALQLADAISAATFTPGQVAEAIAAGDSYLTGSTAWHAVPSAMLEELEAEMRVGTKGGRVWDIAKSKASRAILLTANVPWFGFQVVSEGAVTAIATRGSALNPVNWLGTHRWWRDMTHDERMEVGQWVGLNSTGGDLKQTRLGSMVDGGKRGFSPAGAVNGWRAMKAHPMWHTPAKGHGPTISQLNPAELMAAADRGKTNITRLLTAHSIVKKAAIADMAKSMSAHDAALTKVMSVFKLGPKEQMAAFAKNPKLLENMADSLNNWLGDWTTLTAAERKGVNRMVMFYPYIRYSTRLALYTLPHDHPAAVAMLAELGQLTVEEYRGIFGDDELPWHLGTVYFGDDGEMRSIDLTRANPGMNALMDLGTNHNLNALVGTAPPWFQWAADQAFHHSSYRDADWRVGGKAAPYGAKGKDYGLVDRGRILAGSAFSMMYPYRLATKRGLPFGLADAQDGTMGDDSLLLSPRPIHYAGKTAISKLQAKNAKTNQDFENEHENVGNALFGPLWPTPTRDVGAAAERGYIKKIKDAAAAKAAKRKQYRATHGGLNPPKPASGFGRSSGGGFGDGGF